MEPAATAIDRFLDDGPPAEVAAATASTAGAFRTLLFTDIESNTALLQKLGDDAWRAALREYERITREQLAAHGGAEVKAMGDGFMASFGSATRALDCAIAMQQAFRAHADAEGPDVRVRIGLNAGEPIAEDNDLFGTAVTMAARITSHAHGGEVLVSDVVRQLVAGKGFAFAERGEAALRGFDDPVRLFELRIPDRRSAT
jgi:class 3 adenylate cyclase